MIYFQDMLLLLLYRCCSRGDVLRAVHIILHTYDSSSAQGISPPPNLFANHSFRKALHGHVHVHVHVVNTRYAYVRVYVRHVIPNLTPAPRAFNFPQIMMEVAHVAMGFE